jgi:hypothetical protein
MIMKKIIIIPLMLILSAQLLGQPTEPVKALTSEDYLQKSKKQKTGAIILLSGGCVLTTTGMIVGFAGFSENLGSIFGPDPNAGSSKETTGTILAVGGLVMMAGSIPLFIASSKNKKRAANASAFFKMESAPVIQHGSFVQSSYPAVSVRINLK